MTQFLKTHLAKSSLFLCTYKAIPLWLLFFVTLNGALPMAKAESIKWHKGQGIGGRRIEKDMGISREKCYDSCKGTLGTGERANGVSYYADFRLCVCHVGQTGRENRGLGWINTYIGKESTLQVALQPVWVKNVWGFNGHTSESELFTYIGKFRYPDECYFNCSRKSNSLNQLPDGVNYGLGINEGLCICIYGQKGRRNEPTKAYNNAVIDYEIIHTPKWQIGEGTSFGRKNIGNYIDETECYIDCSMTFNEQKFVANGVTMDANSCYCEFGQTKRAASKTRYRNTLIKRSFEWKLRRPTGHIEIIISNKTADYLWQLTVDNGYYIRLNFTDFLLANSKNCKDNYLQVWNGFVGSANTVGQYCGTVPPPDVEIPNRFAAIQYYSSISNRPAAFTIKFEQFLPDEKGRTVSGLRNHYAVTIGISCSAGVLFVLLLAFLIWKRKTFGKQITAPRSSIRTSKNAFCSGENANKWEIPTKNIRFHEVIGEGAFGKVYLATLLDARPLNTVKIEFTQNMKVAVKILEENADSSRKLELLQEIEMMKEIGFHDNVITMLGCVTDELTSCLILEFMENGSLLQCLREERKRVQTQKSSEYLEPVEWETLKLTVNDLLRVAWQISRGMEHIAYKGIVHRDLAARNILLGPNKSCKIADFGLSRFADVDNVYMAKHRHKLPVKWMPLEAIIDQKFSEFSDVWSYGVVLFELVTLGGSPYPCMTAIEMVRFLKSGARMARPGNCSEEMYAMMQRCWHTEPQMRPSFSTIKQQLEMLMSKETPYLDFNLDFNNEYYLFPSFKSDDNTMEDLIFEF